MWPNHINFRFLTRVRSLSYGGFSNGGLYLFANLLICNMVLIGNVKKSFCIMSSETCVLFSNSAVKVPDSQSYRNMEMTRERISFIFDPRDIVVISPNWLQFCKSCSGFGNPWENLCFEPSPVLVIPKEISHIVSHKRTFPFWKWNLGKYRVLRKSNRHMHREKNFISF